MIIHYPPFNIHHFPSLGSTNDQLKTMVDAPEFTCVVADEQTAGRGRRARAWHSSPGEGLYLSVLLRPQPEFSSKIPLISLLAAIAVAETLIERGVDGVDIKWPNDVLVGERKISGVLAEAVGAGVESLRLVLGVGVNLNHRSFPQELNETATSVAIETGESVVVNSFRDRLLDRIAHWYEIWRRDDSGPGHSGHDYSRHDYSRHDYSRHDYSRLIVDRWQRLSTFARDQQVIVTLDNEKITGLTAGLTETGALRLIVAGGQVKVILAGEVSRLRKPAGR
jgi:BirA family biotin operon repressor/biotin-[acetyl-CoA-carboxylase] ligase